MNWVIHTVTMSKQTLNAEIDATLQKFLKENNLCVHGIWAVDRFGRLIQQHCGCCRSCIWVEQCRQLGGEKCHSPVCVDCREEFNLHEKWAETCLTYAQLTAAPESSYDDGGCEDGICGACRWCDSLGP